MVRRAIKNSAAWGIIAVMALVTSAACVSQSQVEVAIPVAPAVTANPAQGSSAPAAPAAVTPTPAGPTLARLTEPGCCVSPTWSADSTQVWFIDRPAPTGVTGLYAVGLDGGRSVLVSERLGEYSPDRQFIAYPEAGETYVERVDGGQRWTIANGGRRVLFSPDSARLAWTESLPSSGGFDQEIDQIHVMDVLGMPQGEPVIVYGGGGISGWLDGERLLVVGKVDPESERSLYSLSLVDGSRVELASGERVRSGIPAPGGAWVAYLVLFDREDPSNDGIWIVSADGQQRFKLGTFGPFQWRDGNRLLLVPQEMGTGLPGRGQRVLEIDAATGEMRALTDPATLPFVIEGGDWRVSPDGQYVAFVSAEDRAIWLLTLP